MTNVCHMSFHALENPDYNFILRVFLITRESEYFHWYFSVIYHCKKGGEFAGGLFNDPIMPEGAAEHLVKHKKKRLKRTYGPLFYFEAILCFFTLFI